MALDVQVPQKDVADVFGFLQNSLRNDIFILINVGDVEAVKELAKTTDINAVDSRGNSPLHYAVSKSNATLVRFFLSLGCDVAIKNKADGHTPLHWAVGKDEFEIVRLLLANPASDVLLGDSRGYNAFHTAAMHGNLNMLHYLVLHYQLKLGGGKEEALFNSSDSRSDSNSAALERCGAEEKVNPIVLQIIDVRDAKGHTALHWATYKGHYAVVMYLIRQGADLNARDSLGNTPLHWAAQQRQDSIISALTRAGADPTIGDHKNQLPESHAIKKAHLGTYKNLRLTQMVPWKTSYLSSPRVIRLSWAVPGLMLLFGFIGSFWMPLWLFSVGALFQLFFFMTYITPLVRKSAVRNPVWSSLLTFGAVLNASYFILYAVMGWAPMFWRVECLAPILVSLVALFVGLWRANRGDPGIIRPLAAHENRAFLHDLAAGLDPKLCPTCLCRRPIRSKHCATCNRCIGGFDHHCNWVNNCVGYKNYPSFLSFLFGIVAVEFLGIVWWIVYLGSLTDGAVNLTYTWTLFTNLPLAWRVAPDVVYMLFILIPTWILQCLALYTQMRNWVDGTNFLERGAPDRFSYLRQEGEFFNPFHLGFLGNMIEKFRPTVDYARVMYDSDIGHKLLSDPDSSYTLPSSPSTSRTSGTSGNTRDLTL